MSDVTVAARRYRGPRPTCDLYLRGHLVHWVQAKRAAEHAFSWGRLEEIDRETVTVRYLDRVDGPRTLALLGYPDGMARLATQSPSIKSLYQLALGAEYAETRWRGARLR